MANYLVTGGCGFIGSHIAEALVGRGQSVRIVDNLSTGNQANVSEF
ncbi:MAG: GDP-mannose 4,6-dehydratase, partial [Planctomycetales bacterium]|nr:GDP-mannose 4,6-dehydratase [Planctomycetales bacterium]